MEVKMIDRAKVNLENGYGNVVFFPMLFQEGAEDYWNLSDLGHEIFNTLMPP